MSEFDNGVKMGIEITNGVWKDKINECLKDIENLKSRPSNNVSVLQQNVFIDCIQAIKRHCLEE